MKSAPLRILQVNSLFTGGGVDNQTLNLAVGLQAAGEDVTLAVAAGSRYEAFARQAGLRVETFSSRNWLKLPFLIRCVQIIRRQRIQIIHAHQGRDYWPSVLATWLAGGKTKVVVTRHLMSAPRALSRNFLLRFAHVIAVSRAVERVIRPRLAGSAARIRQIYCGVDFSKFLPTRTPEVWRFREQKNWATEHLVLAVIGTFHAPEGKGQPQFLEAAARLKDEFPHARFAIIGRGEIGELLKKRIVELGLEKVAAVHPFEEQMSLCMSAIDVLVHPTQKGEALGLVTIEALASGRPVIASRKDGLTECFQDGEHGFLVPPGDVPALTEAMRTLLKDADLRQRFGAAGSAFVRARFGLAAIAYQTCDFYLQVCSGVA